MSTTPRETPPTPEALRAVGLRIAAVVTTFPKTGLQNFSGKDISVQHKEHPRWTVADGDRTAHPAYEHKLDIQPSDKQQAAASGVIRIRHSETYFVNAGFVNEDGGGERGTRRNTRIDGWHRVDIGGTTIFTGSETVQEGQDDWRFQAMEHLDFSVLKN